MENNLIKMPSFRHLELLSIVWLLVVAANEKANIKNIAPTG